MNTLLVVDDEKSVRYSFERMFEEEYRILTAEDGESGLNVLETSFIGVDVVFCDVKMPGIGGVETLKKIKEINKNIPVVLMTAFGDSDTAINAMKEGAFDYVLKPFDNNELKEIIKKAVTSSKIQQEAAISSGEENPDKVEIIMGKSKAILDVCKMIGQVASTDFLVLLSGESGVGKEIVARAIYNYSERKGKPFLAVNCAALPEGIIEAELFGCEKGAFTGAEKRRIGRFEQCDGGTIFLDEIGDMSLPIQAKLLRVLHDGTFERVGSNDTIRTDVRIIAASNKDLSDEVESGRFREDLFHRLNVFAIHIRPLRERKEDIPVLSEYFVSRLAKKTKKQIRGISPQAMDTFMSYNWPGNVRELENVIKRAVIVANGDVIGVNDIDLAHDNNKHELSNAVRSILQSVISTETSTDIFHCVITCTERILIEEALKLTNGNQLQTSELLGISRVTLRKKIHDYNIATG
jgi:DNA-binding NtrC family response regulator